MRIGQPGRFPLWVVAPPFGPTQRDSPDRCAVVQQMTCQAIEYNNGVCAPGCKCPVRRVATYDTEHANSYESMGQTVNPATPADEIIGGVWFRGVKKEDVYAALQRMRD